MKIVSHVSMRRILSSKRSALTLCRPIGITLFCVTEQTSLITFQTSEASPFLSFQNGGFYCLMTIPSARNHQLGCLAGWYHKARNGFGFRPFPVPQHDALFSIRVQNSLCIPIKILPKLWLSTQSKALSCRQFGNSNQGFSTGCGLTDSMHLQLSIELCS